MPASTQVSVREYLSTTYRPDCDYVDGEIVERNLGEKNHSTLQANLTAFFVVRKKQWNIVVYTEQRVQVSATRFRIPDICITRADAPDEQILTHSPLLCVEILSPEDTLPRLMERIKDYFAMGVQHVWVIEPALRIPYQAAPDGLTEAKDGILRVPGTPIEVPLADLFD